MSELTHCSICGCALEDEAECYEVENEILCQECYDNETVVCDHCSERCIERNTVSDEILSSVQIATIIITTAVQTAKLSCIRTILLRGD